MCRRLSLILSLCTVPTLHLWAVTLAGQEVRVSEPHVVPIDLEGRPLIEPHLAVHPSNPDHLLGAVMVSTTAQASNPAEFRRIGVDRTCVAFHSLDGGETWQRHDFPLSSCFDPWVAITAEGDAVLSVLASDASLPDQPGGLVVYHSEDGGQTWAADAVGLGTGHDHQTMIVDLNSPDRRNWVYIVSSRDVEGEGGKEHRGIFVVRSRDGGRTFDTPVHVIPSNVMVNVETAMVLPDEALLVPFVDPWRETPDGVVDIEHRRGWVLRSDDGGYSFSSPNFALEGCGPPRFSLSASAADVGTSSQWRGRTYFACNERGGGAVLVAYSPDGGETWSEARRIHRAGADSATLRQVMAMAVSHDGILGVMWIERTGPATNEIPYPSCYDVFFSASLDGGRTFLAEVPISTGRSCVNMDINGATARAWPNGGDYYGMVAISDNEFRLLWPEARDAIYGLLTATVAVQDE